MSICARRLGSGLLGHSTRNVGRSGVRQVFGGAESTGSGSSSTTSWKLLGAMAGSGFVGGLALAGQVAFAEEFVIHPPALPWSHNGLFKSYNHESLRRGFQVYSQVCAACHSMEKTYWRQLIGVTHSDIELKALAAEHMYVDGPDDEGKMFERPGKLVDELPFPYPNNKAARAANNGALPPDLSHIVFARDGKEDYIFHLLTGYTDAPAGVKVMDGMHYHPYFGGNQIGMAKALYEGVMEYEDGTPATVSQMAKDVTEFLVWSCDHHRDRRNRDLMRMLMMTGLGLLVVWYWNKQKWMPYFTKKSRFVDLPKRR